jgi:ADP-heptose:LPS heptosyltransferase
MFSAMRPHDEPHWDHHKLHESDYYFNIVKEVYGFKCWKPTQFIPVADSPVLPTGKKRIVLCNGGFGYLVALKKYDHFKELAIELKNLYGDDLILIKIGTSKELSDVEADIDYVDKLSLTETAKVIQQADLMITNDTGNMHIADALATPQIVLWGGSVLAKNKPYCGMNKIINLKLPCQPCQNEGGYRECKNLKCMNDITVSEIMFNVRSYFNEGKFYE